jgi:FKBP-type peptidyl-prolyl cis-trans isomerase
MSQKTLYTGIAVAVVLIVVGIFFILGVPFSTQSLNGGVQSQSLSQPAADNTQLGVQDEVVGTGATAQAGEAVIIAYTGKLADGTVFDTSLGKPAAPSCPAGTKEGFCFTLGAGEVIPGFDQGLAGMQVGGKRMLTIPPSLGYGAQAVGPIPANSTLIFEVELLKVAPAAPTTPVAPEGPAAN